MKLQKLFKTLYMIGAFALVFVAGILYDKVNSFQGGSGPIGAPKKEIDESMVLPEEGFELPISWGDLGPRLIELGVIDEEKFTDTVNLDSFEEKVLTVGSEEKIVINSDNSRFVVNMLWAIGLAQKSQVYEEGPFGKEYKADRGNFASTGGWTLAKGDAVQYLGKFDLIPLSPEQHQRVMDISKNVFRPCCDNPTWFPDCNHGMAALAAIQMMVSQNMSDEEIYKNVLKLNSFWFPNQYLTVATYFARQGVTWDKVDAKRVLGKEFSSSSGNAIITKEVNPEPSNKGGGGCGA